MRLRRLIQWILIQVGVVFDSSRPIYCIDLKGYVINLVLLQLFSFLKVVFLLLIVVYEMVIKMSIMLIHILIMGVSIKSFAFS